MIFIRREPTSPVAYGLSYPSIHCQSYVDPKSKNVAKETEASKAQLETEGHVLYQTRSAYITENKSNYSIAFDLPGVKQQDIKIVVDKGVLKVNAERKVGATSVAKYAEKFAIDETVVDVEKLEAKLRDGVLTLTVPKKEDSKPVSLTVHGLEPAPLAENSKDLVVTIDLPGIKLADLRVEFHNGDVVVEGERKSYRGKVSRFRRVFQVRDSDYQTDKLQAYLVDGVLTLIAPVKPSQPAKVISLTSDDQEIHVASVKERQIVVETAEDDEDALVQVAASEDSKSEKEWHHVLEEVESSH